VKGKPVLICYYEKVSYIVNSKINLIPKEGPLGRKGRKPLLLLAWKGGGGGAN
jgi:hypothetical protein